MGSVANHLKVHFLYFTWNLVFWSSLNINSEKMIQSVVHMLLSRDHIISLVPWAFLPFLRKVSMIVLKQSAYSLVRLASLLMVVISGGFVHIFGSVVGSAYSLVLLAYHLMVVKSPFLCIFSVFWWLSVTVLWPKKVPAHLLYYNSFCDIFYIKTHFDEQLVYWYAPGIILSVVR